MPSHPASAKFPPVENLTDADLRRIIAAAPDNRLHWSAREKSAWNERTKRDELISDA